MDNNDTLHALENKLPVQVDITSRVNKISRDRFQKTFVSKEIDADDFAIMIAILREPEVTQMQIARSLYRGKAHVGKMIAKLEEKGLVNRTIKNNQILNKSLTKKGKELCQSGIEKVEGIIDRKINEEFSAEEQEQFISFLIRYRKVLNSIIDTHLK